MGRKNQGWEVWQFERSHSDLQWKNKRFTSEILGPNGIIRAENLVSNQRVLRFIPITVKDL